jgi:type VI secretion system VasD/TssJ family lipoprotein
MERVARPLDPSADRRLASPIVRPFLSSTGRARTLFASVFALALIAGCAKLPFVGKPMLHVFLTAAADCNSCDKPSGYPLTYRVLQVTDASALTGASLTQVWDKEEKLLGGALLKKTDAYIDPGQARELPLEPAPGAKSLVVVGNFCKSKGSCWYYVQSLSKSGTVKLIAGSSCFTEGK